MSRRRRNPLQQCPLEPHRAAPRLQVCSPPLRHRWALGTLFASMLAIAGCVEEDPFPPLEPVVEEKPQVEQPDPPFSGDLGEEFEAVGDLRGPYELPQKVRHKPTGMVLILVPQGRYTMGTPDDEHDRDGDEAQRLGRVRRPFYLAEAEVTVGLWKQFMGVEGLTSAEKENDDLPKSGATWHEVHQLLEKMNEKHEKGWRLPTEMEWEYACRAGTTTPFNVGEDITPEQANFNGEWPYHGRSKGLNRGKPMAVRSFAANAWGFYDMHGNVWEWCSDFYVNHPEQGKQARGQPGDPRVMRGGGFTSRAKQLRSGYRDGYPPSSSGAKYGCRLAKSILDE